MTHPDLKIDLAGKVTRVAVTSDPMTIGRSASCDIVIDHPSISKVHASIEQIAEGRWRISDLDSKNGLVVTGVRERRAILTGSEVVRLGEASLTIDARRPKKFPPLATPLKMLLGGAVLLLLLEMRPTESPTPAVEPATSSRPPLQEARSDTEQAAIVEPEQEPKPQVPSVANSSSDEKITVDRVSRERTVVIEDHSWPRAVGIFRRLLGRSPTTGEFQGLRQVGAEGMVRSSSGSGEMWRARARNFVGEGGRVPPELRRLREAPVDRSLWGEWLAREPASPAAAPLPDSGGGDTLFSSWVTAAPPWLPGEQGETIEQLRSIWVSLLDRAPEYEEEVILESLVAQGVSPGEVGTRLALLLALSPDGFDPQPGPGEELAWVQRWCGRLLGERIDEEIQMRWADEITRGELSPLLARARWATAAFPPLPGEPPIFAPRGVPRLQIDLFIIAETGSLVSDPRKYSRFWSRLSRAHLHLFPDGAELRKEISRLLDLDSRGTWMEVQGVGERRVDGWLLPGFAELAERLAVAGALPREMVSDGRLVEDLASAGIPLAATVESTSLFRAGGWRLVPGEWRAPLYTEATRMLLLAGAQLKARPFASLSLRLALPATAFSGERKEWQELMTALSLLENACEDHAFDLWFWGNATGGHSALRVVTGPAITRGRVFRELVPALASRPDLKSPAEGTDSGEEGGR